MLQTAVGRIVVASVALLAAAVVAGLVVLWPGDSNEVSLVAGSRAQTQQAQVVDSRPTACRNPAVDDCRRLSIELRSGPRAGERSFLTVGDAGPAPGLDAGAQLRVVRNELPAGADPGVMDPYALVEVDRRSPMLWLLLVFAALVIVFGRLRGALALVGLGVSVLIVVEFVIPALLEDKPPVAVALVGSFAVMLVTIALAHGREPRRDGAARAAIHERGRADRLQLRGGEPAPGQRPDALAHRPGAGRNGDRRARRARRRDREPGVDRDGAAERQPGPARARALPRRALSRSRSRGRDGQHARAGLCRRVAPGPARVRDRRHRVRRHDQSRGGRRAGDRDAGRLDRADPRRPGHHRARRVPRHAAARGGAPRSGRTLALGRLPRSMSHETARSSRAS